MVDSFYTPTDLASRLVNHVKKVQIKNVIDFCIGNGELIRAALKKWPDIKCYGTDISENAIKIVKTNHPSWFLSKCDFLNDNSRNRCNIIRQNKNGFDLVILNPPFSCIGGTIHEVTLNGIPFKVSTAMKFLAESIKYISKDGCLVAIMPISICYSQKDKKLWDYLVENYNLSILETPNGNYFKNCSPSIVLVSININHKPNPFPTDSKISLNFTDYTIFRGKVSRCDAIEDALGYHFIHSTNIRNNKLEGLNIKVLCKSSEISGPAILIPRVGKPNHKKMCIIDNGSRYTLSDCIIAIQTKNVTIANQLFKRLLSNWEQLKELYKGTGAKFITIERLSIFLGRNKSEDVKMLIPSLSFPLAKSLLPSLKSNCSKKFCSTEFPYDLDKELLLQKMEESLVNDDSSLQKTQKLNDTGVS